MYLTSYQPWSLFDRLSGLNGPLNSPINGSASSDVADSVVRQWAPLVDIEEQENAYLLRADLPGVDVKDIEITLDQGVLKIAGQRRQENTVSEEGYRRVERRFGHFERQFTLPETANDEQVEARSANGVLEVTIAKKETTKPRRIDVQH